MKHKTYSIAEQQQPVPVLLYDPADCPTCGRPGRFLCMDADGAAWYKCRSCHKVWEDVVIFELEEEPERWH